MSKELKMEVFASKEPVKSVKLHVYEFHTSELYENKYRLIRSAVWKMRNVNACGVFEDGSYIYTTEKISEEIPNATFRLTYLGEQELNVLDHKKVYSELIKHWITQKLRTVKIQKNSKEYYKYACRSNVTSRWIQTEKGFQTFYSGNRQISLERKYNFTVKILDDGKAYLKIDTSSVFSSNQTVYDYITQGMNPIGMEVKNEWGKNNQTGILTEICDYTVVNKIDFADSLKAYYTDMKKEGYRVENLPDQTPVVRVELQVGKIYPYYPQALKPVLTREKVGQIDARFSMAIEKYIKRDMITRIELDKDFIQDIGSIAQLGDLEFENDMCNVKELGYLKGKVESPALTCGQGKRLRCGEEFKVFNYGFYQKPDEKIKIGYIYPKNTVDLIKAVVNGICEFAAYGKYQGEKDAYIIPGLLDIQMKPMIKEEYELGDITDYKRAAQRLRKVEGIDIVIGIVPDGMDEDGPYNPFKTIWAEANIPSQMISMKTAQLFYRGKREGNKSKYYLHNIVLGILGKTGGIPWVIKEMPGNVDCFVGLDVATLEKGIHYPACSVVFDKSGRLLGLTHGAAPIIKNFKDANEELSFISEEIKKLKDNGVALNDICVVARTKSLLDDYVRQLKGEGINTFVIKRNKNDDRGLMGVRVATMHRVKGLEFKYVFVVAVNNRIVPLPAAINHTDTISEAESITSEKCLLYVSLTRAQKGAYITSYGKKSEFLK